MNIDFTYQNPTRIHFGKSAMQYLPEELALYGKNVLLLYGRNSIKASGLYDTVMLDLQKAGKNVVELSGIKSNPTYAQVLQGAKLVREHKVDLILAVGGGSVIDCAKGISAAAYCTEDPWTLYWEHQAPLANPVVPIGTILTMTGTASEMNGGSVITNDDKKLKLGRVFPLETMAPKFSILNPEFTYTVPKYQMISGIFDIFSHLMEQYFGGNDDCVSDYLLEGDMLALISAARAALKDPHNYEARSNIMWCATMGLNKILAVSKEQDWEVHMIEHQLGAYTDCAHGIGLAIISVPYYRAVYKYGLHRFVRYAKNIWHVNPEGKSDEQVALEGIDCLSKFIQELGIPQTLQEVGATEEMLPLIAESTIKGGGYHVVTTEEVLDILKACF
ncbi:MAG: iron-containing alcohol dehydrogenase [Bacteroidales bacterium]|nr:iron-containing alcohol dehydrogenase [Bacteroidales bacterium]